MPRKKAKRSNVIMLKEGAARTATARYDTREDRDFGIYKPGGPPDAPGRMGCYYAAVGVIDGHRGPACAEKVAQYLPYCISTSCDNKEVRSSGANVLRTAFADAEQHLLDERSGACCCVALVYTPPPSSGAAARVTLDVAWLGDCRAFVARRSGPIERLTTDHAPAEERDRIEAAGGMLVNDDGLWRVGVKPEPGGEAQKVDLLATCRAFGDADFKRPNAAVVMTPGVATLALEPDHEFIILCTDGVYEGLPTDERVLAAVKAGIADDEFGNPEAGAQAVVDAAFAGGATDDVTCVVWQTELE